MLLDLNSFMKKIAIECLRHSNQQVWVTLGQNLGRKGLTDISQILCQSGRDKGLSCAKDLDVWAQCTNVTDRQTDRQTTER